MALAVVAAVSLACWLAFALHPARPWDLRPLGEEEPPPREPTAWPSLSVLVPARNEADVLPATLPALLAQDYPGRWEAVLVDDRSEDETAARAAELGDARLAVVSGAPLPAGWVGKVWALEQAREAAGAAGYYLLTDADIHHGPGSLRRLVAESVEGGLVLNSRMALLRAATPAERLLIPAFAFFFASLYPMRWVNRQRRPFAAAAGGCMLVDAGALARAGGFAAIRGEIIDDVNLARRLVAQGTIRLATSRVDVISVRAYPGVAAVWRMVRRTAFDQLRYSWLLLAATVSLIALLFAAPAGLALHGLVTGAWAQAGLAGAAAVLSVALYLPAVRRFSLAPRWALTLPLAGLLYGAMTVDSAVRHAAGKGGRW